MSFILDALKKSESERQRQSGPALLEMRIAPPSRTLPAWAVIVGALLVVCVVVLGWLALRPGAPQRVAPSQASSARIAAGAQLRADTAPVPSPEAITPTAVVAAVAAVAAAPAVAPAPSAAAPPNARANLQAYAAVNGTVPELRLDLHVYAPDPADRYAFINMRKVREGDTTPEGVQVRQITRDGVIVEYHGTEFLLGRQ